MPINKTTGEVVSVSPFSKLARPVVGQKRGETIIQHRDFAYDEETRGLKIFDASKEDREAYIQSFKDDCGVYNILAKYKITGDLSLLNARPVTYGDISDLPVDELNPAKLQEEADSKLAALGQKLGRNITAEELAGMSPDQLAALILEASTPKEEVIKKDEVKENA